MLSIKNSMNSLNYEIFTKMNDFPIVYKGNTFLVDPAYFAIYSIKFREIFNPAFADFSQVTLTGNYQPKSVDIFCALCQGKEVSIPDSCMKDIASLATLFNAEEILESATRIIHSKIDGSFKPDTRGSVVYENKKNESVFSKTNDAIPLAPTQLVFGKGAKQAPQQQNAQQAQPDSSSSQATSASSSEQKNVDHSGKYYIEVPVVYEFRQEKKLLKCDKYYQYQNGELIAVAKTRSTSVVINNGNEVHFEQINDSSADIQRLNYINIIRADGHKHTLRYYRDPDTGLMTMHVMFKIGNDDIIMTGLRSMPKDDSVFGTSKVITPKQPCTLYLQDGKIAMAIIQLDSGQFLMKCNLKVSNVFAFAIALSAIVGPQSTSDK